MKMTYANVMSTIAMVAAMTTGTSYAAATIGANAVGTKQIKNNNVTLSDLHPTVRAKLNARPTTGGGGSTTPAPTGWAIYDATADSVMPSGQSFAVMGSLPARNVTMRLRGTLKNIGNEPVTWLIEAGKAGGMTRIQCVPQAALGAGATVSLDHCVEGGTTFNANNRPDYVKVTVYAADGTAEGNARVARSIQGQVRIDWK